MPEPRPNLAIDPEGLRRLRKRYRGLLDTDKLLAEAIQMTPATVNRVINGVHAPGPRLIAAVRKTFGDQWGISLFKVVEDDK